MVKIINLARTVIFVIVAAVFVVLVVPRFFGIVPRVVMSGSMEPTIMTGSICLVNERVDPDSLEVGDVVAFTLVSGKEVTHRIIQKDATTFRTKGDNNEDPDISPISRDQVVGETVLTIPYLGYLIVGLKTPQGIIIAVTALAVFILLGFITPRVKEKKEETEAKPVFDLEDESDF